MENNESLKNGIRQMFECIINGVETSDGEAGLIHLMNYIRTFAESEINRLTGLKENQNAIQN